MGYSNYWQIPAVVGEIFLLNRNLPIVELLRDDLFSRPELAELHFYQDNKEIFDFIPRNDDNFIRPGDIYELFYWGKDKKWSSPGKQKAKAPYLQFSNIPQNTLLFLHDETRGKEEEVFFLQNGEQVFVNSLPVN